MNTYFKPVRKNRLLSQVVAGLVLVFLLFSNLQHAIALDIILPGGFMPNPELEQSCGLDIALVMDESSSIFGEGVVTGPNMFPTMQTAMKSFVDAFAGTPTQFALIDFGTNAFLRTSFTSDTEAVKALIDQPGLGGSFGTEFTNWEQALAVAHNQFPNRSNPDLVVFASDGNANKFGNPAEPPGGERDETGAVAAAADVANDMKSDGITILPFAIGVALDIENLEAISGAGDVVETDFDTLAEDLAALATELCGGTISVTKFIDEDGNLGNVDDITPGEGWTFTVAGNQVVTDANGQTMPVEVDPGTYSVSEELQLQEGFELADAFCTLMSNGNIEVGTLEGNAIVGIEVGNEDIVSCVFYNTPLSVCDDPGALNFEDVGTCVYPEVTLCKIDENETGLPGWEVFLQNPEDSAERYGGITGSDGCVIATSNASSNSTSGSGVPPGNYVLGEVLQNGWVIVAGSGETVTVASSTEKFFLINREISDMCANLDGIQEEIPSGYVAHEGNCYVPGSITLDKVVTGAGASESATFNFEGSWFEGTFPLSASATSTEPPSDSDLVPAQYSVSETGLPGNYTLEQILCAVGQTPKTDLDQVANQFTFTLEADTDGVVENVLCTFTNHFNEPDPEFGSISGTKRDWLTDNGLWGWTIFIDENENGVLDEGEDSTITDNDGNYSFTVEDGIYAVCEVPQIGFTQIEPDPNTNFGCQTIEIDGNNDVTEVDFVNQRDRGPVCEIGDNLLQNGSFEEPVVEHQNLWDTFASVLGWMIEQVTDGDPSELELQRGFGGNEAADGKQYAELDAEDPNGSSLRITQGVALEEGAEYELTWAFAPRPNTNASQNQLSVLLDNVEVATSGPASIDTPLTQSDWTVGSYTFVADSTSGEVAFEDAGVLQNDTFGTLLDDAILCKIADPVPGCTDPEANNFDPDATIDDGSCEFGGGGGGGGDENQCESFVSTKTVVAPNQDFILSWDLDEDISFVTISDILGTFGPMGSAQTSVTEDTIFVLTAFNEEEEEEFTCDLGIEISSGGGGGGGGSSSSGGGGGGGQTPEVLGIEREILPIGAPDTGLGATSREALPLIPFVLTFLVAFALVSKVRSARELTAVSYR